MTTPTFPAPTPAQIALAQSGRAATAAIAWRNSARVTLPNGQVVRPRSAVAFRIVRACASGLPATPIAVSVGSYVVLDTPEA